MDIDGNRRLQLLRAVGMMIYGDEWQRPMARELGMLHPRTPLAPTDEHGRPLDDRLVRRWVSGERPVPVWVPGALEQILERAELLALGRAQELRESKTRLFGASV